VWVHNIANTAAASRLASLFSGDIETLLPPRTYGVDIKYTLGGK
jgi:hypothetical protein